MTRHLDAQLEHFAQVRHAERFLWQTEDGFVLEQEHATIAPLVRAIREQLEASKPLRVLESGCGEGVNLVHLRQCGLDDARVSLSGIDPSPEAVSEAVRHGLDVREANGLALPFPDASFDVVFCRDVLHHLANDAERAQFFAEMTRVAKPDGLVAAIEPNPRNPMILCLSLAVPAEKGLRDIGEGHIVRSLPSPVVHRVAPSAAWRLFYHYRSPARRFGPGLTRRALDTWGALCRRLAPSSFWSYRVYLWRRR